MEARRAMFSFFFERWGWLGERSIGTGEGVLDHERINSQACQGIVTGSCAKLQRSSKLPDGEIIQNRKKKEREKLRIELGFKLGSEVECRSSSNSFHQAKSVGEKESKC